MIAPLSPLGRAIRRLLADETGATVIETAIVAPVLILLSLGTFDISRMIAHQHELDAASIDVEGIILAVASGSTGTTPSAIKQVIVNSLGISADKVSVRKVYRCGTSSLLISDPTLCVTGSTVSTYVRVRIADSLTPIWTNFGIGGPMNYWVVRTVQVS